MTFIYKLEIDLHILWRYTGCANMNFLHQGFRKLSSDRQTDTTEIIYHAASQMVNKQEAALHVQLKPWSQGWSLGGVIQRCSTFNT